MIREIQIIEPEKAACEWWASAEGLNGVDKLTFNPTGLTILWGPNGSGKSTVLKTLARMTFCEQAGIPKVTRMAIFELEIRVASQEYEYKDGVRLIHDGQPVHFFDPTNTPGIYGGAFDDDFHGEALNTIKIRKNSSGQQVRMQLARVLESMETLEKVAWRLSSSCDYSPWDRHKAMAERLLARTDGVEAGARTLLLDEPDRSLSIPAQAEFWKELCEHEDKQIIVATHSPFALNIHGAQYIDVQPGYLAESRKAIAGLTMETS